MPGIRVAGSAADHPAVASRSGTRSAGVRAMNPGVSSEGASGTQPSRGIRPKARLIPATPHKAVGMRMEPPVSVATAAGTSPAATAAADPPLDPPGTKSRLHGLRVPVPSGCWVVMPQPNSWDLVRPTMTAPARRSLRTIPASVAATAPARAREP